MDGELARVGMREMGLGFEEGVGVIRGYIYNWLLSRLYLEADVPKGRHIDGVVVVIHREW